MEHIKEILTKHSHGNVNTVSLCADRIQLAKRRWRGVAEDGREFGFDLESPLKHRDYFFTIDNTQYVVEQTPEKVLFISCDGTIPAAQLGWMIGNLHFPAAFIDGGIMVEDDLAVRQMLERNHIGFSEENRVFCPLSAAGHHHHHHGDEGSGHSHSHSH